MWQSGDAELIGAGEYWCLYCKRVIIGDPVRQADGEAGYVFVHDDVPHPIDATYDEDERPQ